MKEIKIILCKTSTKCLSTYGAQESVTAQHYVMLCPTKKVPSEYNSFQKKIV